MEWNRQIFKVNNLWNEFLSKEIEKEYFKDIVDFLNTNSHQIIFPKKEDVFNAFKLCNLDDIKVVILGQDPYHGYNQANGLAFSVNLGIKNPPSLSNMYKELTEDLGITRQNGDLTSWAKQGVFMLNNTLTVFKGMANSHRDIGWNTFTNNVIKYLDQEVQPIFLLWGSFAQKKAKLIKHSQILKAPHPSPLSAYRGFFGSKPYSKINKILKDNNKKQIDWR